MPTFAGIEDYYELMKPKVMRLSIFTAMVGMMLAPGNITIATFVVALITIAMGAGAAGVLNMWYDADIDAIMKRTAERPIPMGKISANEALGFGIILTVVSVSAMGIWINWIAAGLLAFTIFFYSVVYTIGLKRTTTQNIVIGGAAGAFVPMIGWAVVVPTISQGSLWLFAIIFLWTPPHFWALALTRKDEYKYANIPMHPNIAGEQATKKQILIYSVLMVIASIMPFWSGSTSAIYAMIAVMLGSVFIYKSVILWKNKNKEAEKNLFVYSIVYLFILFLVILVDASVQRFQGLI